MKVDTRSRADDAIHRACLELRRHRFHKKKRFLRESNLLRFGKKRVTKWVFTMKLNCPVATRHTVYYSTTIVSLDGIWNVNQGFDLFSSFFRASISSFDALGGISKRLRSASDQYHWASGHTPSGI